VYKLTDITGPYTEGLTSRIQIFQCIQNSKPFVYVIFLSLNIFMSTFVSELLLCNEEFSLLEYNAV
jgi:hypothetical protein